MATAVSEQAILDALHRVPRGRWSEVLSFIQSLEPAPDEASQSQPPMTAADLLHSGLVGLWADRPDIGESQHFARQLREQAQRRSHQR